MQQRTVVLGLDQTMAVFVQPDDVLTSPCMLACVQPDFKGGKVSLRIREQYRVRAIF